MTTIATEAIAAQCRGTPGVQVLDNRGLAVRALQYNRNLAGEDAEQLMTRQRYSATGQLLSSLDPRLGAAQQLDPTLPPNFRYLASLSGRQLRSQSQDAGTGVRLYDIEGGPIWQRASRGQCTRWCYDALHRPTLKFEQAAANEPERISERYTYADGSTVAAAANGRGRLLTQHDTAGLNETPRYSLSGQVLLNTRRLLQTSVPASDWQGDAAAWEAALEQQTYTSRQGFDALGRVAWSLDAKGNRQQPQFNVAGQLLSSQLTLAGQSCPRVLLRRVRYSAAGQVQWEEAGNGVVNDYRYEAQTQRLNRLTVSRPAQNGRSTLLQDLDYQYDPVGNILAISDAAQAIRYHQNQRIAPSNAYQYDALYQLLSATGRENVDAGQQGPGLPLPQVPLSADPNRYSHYTRRYSYDRGGNLTQIRHQGSKNYTQDLVVAPTSNRAVAQSGFLTPGDVDGHFDAAGNLKQLASGQPLSWDGRNQLQEVLQVQRDGGADDRECYRYDGAGQRLQKTSVSQTHATERQADVIYLPGLELRRTVSVQGENRTTVENLQVIRGQAVGRAQVQVLHWDVGEPADIPNDQVRYSLNNQIGSSLLELDQAADILTLEEYFPFGGTAVWSGKSSGETQYKFVRYSGKERDATGLYYYGFRYYAPWLGRWLNPDPAGTVDGLNLYGFVRNNPVSYEDADGLSSIPKIAHYAWEGDDVSPINLFNVLNFKRLNPDYDVNFWTSRPMSFFKTLDKMATGYGSIYRHLAFNRGQPLGINVRNPAELYEKSKNSTLGSFYEREKNGYYKNYAAASDITRMMALDAEGGIYMDLDVSTIRPVQLPENNNNFFMFFSEQKGYGNGVLASAPATEATHDILSYIENMYLTRSESWSEKRSDEFIRRSLTIASSGPEALYYGASENLQIFPETGFGQRRADLQNLQRLMGNNQMFGTPQKPYAFNRDSLLGLGHQAGLNADSTWISMKSKRRSSIS